MGRRGRTVPEALLTARGIRKEYPGTVALDGAMLEVEAGEIHGLLGANGAGKSTLVKIIAGAERPDSGEIYFAGQARDFRRPIDGLHAGIASIYQELLLVPEMTVAQNLMLGRNPKTRLGALDIGAQRAAADRALEQVGAHFSSEKLVKDLSVANQQLVAIAKALTMDAKLLVMDEPSAALEEQELVRVFSVIRDFAAGGTDSGGRGVIYITHRLGEIMEICNRATVLRNGKNAGVFKIADVSEKDLVSAMIGENRTLVERSSDARAPAPEREVLFSVKRATYGAKVDVRGLNVHRGEIVGIAGLGGSGRTELLRALYGLDHSQLDATLGGRAYRPKDAREAIHLGVGLVPEDRKTQGLVLFHSIIQNAALPALRGKLAVTRSMLDSMTNSVLSSLGLKAASRWQLAGSLSGGNQQKVVLGKWLVRGASLLLLDEPSRGLDVGAKADLYAQVRKLAAQGAGIIVVSSEIEELLANCDVIWVLNDGRNMLKFDAYTCDHAEVMHAVVAGSGPASGSEGRDESRG